ncbi:hypothetical protein HDV00_001039 [Rhizophlyctis rosea]|nr:hypothetical protein HDV00_001039 [Rhizophlyctis rosea]
MSTQEYLDHSKASVPAIDARGNQVSAVDSSPATTSDAQAYNVNAESAGNTLGVSAGGRTWDAADTLGTAGSHPPIHPGAGTAEERPKLPRHGAM